MCHPATICGSVLGQVCNSDAAPNLHELDIAIPGIVEKARPVRASESDDVAGPLTANGVSAAAAGRRMVCYDEPREA
jgi:hypothetical protein